MTSWAERLSTIATRWRTEDKSIRQLFEESAPPTDVSDEALRTAVGEVLLTNPGLIEAWQAYSYDKLGTPSPYLDGLKVGFYDGGSRDVVSHALPIDACIDFICRETRWVLRRRHGA